VSLQSSGRRDDDHDDVVHDQHERYHDFEQHDYDDVACR
jgi:hypothetical protein